VSWSGSWQQRQHRNASIRQVRRFDTSEMSSMKNRLPVSIPQGSITDVLGTRTSNGARRDPGRFSLLIKPAGAECNLRCVYCFYRPTRRLYREEQQHRMSAKVLEQLVSSYLATPQPSYAFGWQGGEPTLMGFEFFRTVTRLQTEYAHPGSVIVNAVQTNGTLISDDLAAHWAAYRFLVGISLDGPPVIHDHYRRDPQGKGSHQSVMAGINRLRRAGVVHNVLALVTDANVRHPEKIYQYLVDHGIDFHQYIPCVEYGSNGTLVPYAIGGDAWGDFLCRIFRRWYPRDVNRVSVRLFDTLMGRLGGEEGLQCSMQPSCGGYAVVEHNGDVFPCDFQVDKELRLGNIMEESWEELLASARYAAFCARKRDFHSDCAACEFLDLCGADCVKYRGGQWKTSSQQRSVLCDGWKKFYTLAVPRLKELRKGC
jgi:uncharacterized protein